MNLLAHLALAADDADHRAGAVLADFLKGPAVDALPARIRAGVQHHRRVDAFTDRHPVVHRSTGRLGGRWGWFGGIIIDVYYDHLLARSWPGHLGDFAAAVRPAIRTAAHLADPGAVPFLTYFAERDGLTQYANLEGITATLAGLTRRIAERIPTKAVDLTLAVPELIEADAALAEDFAQFWPELWAHAGGGRQI